MTNKQLNDYKLELKKWKLPYFKQYVRGEITYEEYQPSISTLSRIVKSFIPALYSIALGGMVLNTINKTLKESKVI